MHACFGLKNAPARPLFLPQSSLGLAKAGRTTRSCAIRPAPQHQNGSCCLHRSDANTAQTELCDADHPARIANLLPSPTSQGRGQGLQHGLARPAQRHAVSRPYGTECEMPKLNTKSSAKKRFKMTATGKVKSAQAGKRHNMIKRSNDFIRKARGTTVLCASDARIVKSFMPYDR